MMTCGGGLRDLNTQRSPSNEAPSPLTGALRWALCAGAVMLFNPASAGAATLPAGFTETLIASGLRQPTAMAFAPDGRLFVCEQGGRLRVIKDGVLLPTPFVTLTVSSVGERGLLGVAFDPNFATNKFVYVYFTATTPTVHNRISRFVADGDVAVPGSETIIFELDNLSSATNHNGGALQFGPDGKLYAGVGDNANGANAQPLDTVPGKMLRINNRDHVLVPGLARRVVPSRSVDAGERWRPPRLPQDGARLP